MLKKLWQTWIVTPIVRFIETQRLALKYTQSAGELQRTMNETLDAYTDYEIAAFYARPRYAPAEVLGEFFRLPGCDAQPETWPEYRAHWRRQFDLKGTKAARFRSVKLNYYPDPNFNPVREQAIQPARGIVNERVPVFGDADYSDDPLEQQEVLREAEEERARNERLATYISENGSPLQPRKFATPQEAMAYEQQKASKT